MLNEFHPVNFYTFFCYTFIFVSLKDSLKQKICSALLLKIDMGEAVEWIFLFLHKKVGFFSSSASLRGCDGLRNVNNILPFELQFPNWDFKTVSVSIYSLIISCFHDILCYERPL